MSSTFDVQPCPVLAEPGNIHLLGHCADCDASRMVKMSADTVEAWYHRGAFGQAEYEAYMHVWATSAYRYGGGGGWAEVPTDPEVLSIVAAIRRHAGIPVPVDLAA